MLDEKAIRRQLVEFEGRLVSLDDERQALLDVVKGYKALLKAMSAPDSVTREPFPQLTLPTRSSAVVGSISMRSAVPTVLERSAQPMHSRDVWEAVQRLGAATAAKDPIAVVDLVILGLHQRGKVEKVGPRTWRWIGGQ